MDSFDRLRTTRLDAALAAGFALFGLVQVIVVPIAQPGLGELFVLGTTLPLAWRRTFPVEAALVAAATWMIPTEGFPILGFFVVILLFFSLGRCGESGLAVAATTLAACVVMAVTTLRGPEEDIAAITGVIVVAAPAAAGRLFRREQRQKQELLDLTHELAAERDRAEEAAVGAERARIAQELHDVVGHEVTLIAIQAEAAAAAVRVAPERAAEPVEAIRATAHRTLGEIRGVLDVLAPAGEASRPTGEAVQSIVERAREAGIDCEFAVTGTPPSEETAVAMAVNRIVRECLTNAARHSSDKAVELNVHWTSGGVEVRSVNHLDARPDAGPDARPPVVPGRGLTGMRHRAELLGGTFEADSIGDCFDVRITIPTAGRP